MAPENQEEYEMLQKLLNNYHNIDREPVYKKSIIFAIDGHKSDDDQWVDNREEILEFRMTSSFVASNSTGDCIGKIKIETIRQ